MAVRIRLQRFGKKGAPFYHIVAADSRSPRDGKFIERLGSYNPITQPATIELDVNTAVKWLQNGAEPTNTAHAILKYKGAMYKNHLLNGVKKGALKAEDVEAKFQSWLDSKNTKVSDHANSIRKAKADAKNSKLAAEKETSDKRKQAQLEAAKAAEAVAETTNEVADTTENVDNAAESADNTEA